MSIHAIILAESNPGKWEGLTGNYPSHSYHIVDKHFALLQSGLMTNEIADKIGMNETENVVGVVIQTDYIQGYHSTVMWEWVKKEEMVSDE